MKTEPEKKRKKSNTLVGDDLLKQFVNKQTKLTVYSQKLWHSDKPFPVREHFHSLSFEDNQKLYLNHIKENWLSTANEVVNPEVIPSICKTATGLANFSEEKHAHLTLVDGDQITLPDGYGVYTFGMPKRVCNITLPDKPENSAHGYTELLSKEQFNSPANQNRDNAIVGFIKTGLDKIDELGFQLSNQDKAQLLNKRIENLSKVEPSESQEEMWGQVINDARWYDGSPVKHKSLLDHFKEKFTITRK